MPACVWEIAPPPPSRPKDFIFVDIVAVLPLLAQQRSSTLKPPPVIAHLSIDRVVCVASAPPQCVADTVWHASMALLERALAKQVPASDLEPHV